MIGGGFTRFQPSDRTPSIIAAILKDGGPKLFSAVLGTIRLKLLRVRIDVVGEGVNQFEPLTL